MNNNILSGLVQASATTNEADKKNLKSMTSAQQAKYAAQQFEAIFLKELLKISMPKQKNEVFGGGLAGDFFHDFMIDEQAKSIASSGGIGLGELLEKEILALDDKKVKSQPDNADTTLKQFNKLRARQSYQ